jgi:hypothetical protein
LGVQPLIDDVDLLHHELDGAAVDASVEMTIQGADTTRVRGANLDAAILRDRPLTLRRTILQRFPILQQTVGPVEVVVGDLRGFTAHCTYGELSGWFNDKDVQIRRAFDDFNRAVEYVLFGTSTWWAGWMALKRFAGRSR